MGDIVEQLQNEGSPLSRAAALEVLELRRQITRISEARDLPEDLVLFSLEYVAEILGVGDRWVRRMVQRGEIPYVSAGNGRYKRIRQSDLRKYVEEKYRGAG